jgi:hypothetical protein
MAIGENSEQKEQLKDLRRGVNGNEWKASVALREFLKDVPISVE